MVTDQITGLTRWAFKPDVSSPMEAGFACGSMVRFFLVHKKSHNVNFFVNKHGIFHPAGGASQPPDGQPRNSGQITEGTRLICEPDVSPDESLMRLRQHGT